ncbi:MAG: hypothetical protein Q7R75_01520 [bacterium]|nr:hypothetical protein [bacterium]
MPRKLKILLVVFFFAFFASFLIHPLFAINQDLARHFKISQVILDTGSVPKSNLFSYTNPDFQFVNTHWLGGVIFYLLSKIIGLKGLVIFTAGILLISFGIIFLLSYKKSQDNFWLALWAGLWVVGIFIERTDARPEIFSYLFFAIFLLVLHYSISRPKWLLLLPILEVIWVNTHIYFFLGPVIFSFFLLEKIIEKRGLKKNKHLLLVGFSIFLATLANPNGLKGVLYPFRVFANYGYTIVENQTVFFLLQFSYHPYIIALFFLAVAFLAVSFFLKGKKISAFDILTAATLSFLGFYAVRNLSIFALGIMPIMVGNLTGPLNEAKEFIKLQTGNAKSRAFEIIMFVIAFVIFSAGIYSNRKNISLYVEPRAKKAADFVIQNNISGNMFNNFDVGGYLINRFYPERKVFIDNRPEAYPAQFFKDVYIPMQEDKEVWDRYSAKYDFNFIFFEHTDMTPWARKFLNIIANDKNWVAVYLDNNEVILVKNSLNNEEIIEKYGRK